MANKTSPGQPMDVLNPVIYLHGDNGGCYRFLGV